MNFSHFKSLIARSVRFLTIAFACSLLIFSNAFPAFATISTTPSDPTEGDAHLDEIQRKSEALLKKDPLNLQETQTEANKGLNEVQGDADINGQNRPSNSRQAQSAAEQVERALEKVTGRD
ncbi:hypothetical protein IFO70_14270 [Phormidium tenue FACHB-886]|nr:hypothetical protein [Phormidium tenue FACHB-886]